MDQLSSCYFCGGALDVSLSEDPVVPRDLRDDGAESKSVVLCGTCRKKLATVVEDVVAATGADPAEEGQSFEGTGFESNEPAETSIEEPRFEEREDDGPVSSGGDVGDATEPSDADRDGETPSASGTDDAESRTDRSAHEGATDTAADEEGDDDGPSLSRLEYNKVMRLLKNREFPVDRMEIRDVATSAYEIRPDEFDAVIEAAIERDLLAEEDGQFVEPN